MAPNDLLPPPMISPISPTRPVTAERSFGGNKAFYNYFNDYSHIQDPNLRRRLALSEIDKVPFGWHHVRAVLVAGVGFFLDSYDIFAINLITSLLGVAFWSGGADDVRNGFGGNNGVLPKPVEQALKASTSAGIILGQVVFGWLADVLGRRRMYGIELIIIILATLCCALVSPSQAVGFTGLMTFWRVAMGVGIGGDYPLSSVITSEFAPTRWRGAMVAAVFSGQGLGQLMAALVSLITTVAFKDSFIGVLDPSQCGAECQLAADRAWRIIVGMGAIPACVALYYRLTIPETPRYTFDVAYDIEKADADIRGYMERKPEGEVDAEKQARMKKIAGPSLNVPRATWADVASYFGQWKNLKVLLGTTLSWFFLDLAFYGLGLNNTVVLHAIGYANGDTLYHQLHNQAVGMIILACAGSLPGYWASVFTIDSIGRKPLQIFGFLILTVLFCILGFAHVHLTEKSFLVLYVICQFFFNFGPNTTTFIVPGECFPTRYRSTGHGLSAAMGKIGAILAQVISIPLLAKDSPSTCTTKSNQCSPWLDKLLQLFALFMLFGTFVSLLIPETKGMTLEELSGEPPTSYNAGRNGSVSHGTKRSRWNPFSGGHPAGFSYPRQGTSGGFSRRRRGKERGRDGGSSPRVGIMTTPEMLAQQEDERQRKKRRFWRGKRNGHRDQGGSSTSNEYVMSSRASTAHGVVEENGVVPAWGAGWGRIDRGPVAVPIDMLALQDMGRLLQQPTGRRQV